MVLGGQSKRSDGFALQTSFMFVNLTNKCRRLRQGILKERFDTRDYQDYTNWSRVSMGKIPDVEKYIAAMPRVLKL